MNDRKFVATMVALAGFLCAAGLAVDGKYAMATENLDPSMRTALPYSQWKDHPGLALVAGQRERLQQASTSE
jgi:hypothetical protein